jgi:hypothetical protein
VVDALQLVREQGGIGHHAAQIRPHHRVERRGGRKAGGAARALHGA